ncbi:class I adenylate-forming enzyme family protein [Phenylobacterium sp.]|uniref:class I adenylate-forming enzyme family protein n=1 Tax=Phenylobacterium sp. TaxID=1871053 RepID=UPI002C2DC9C2|nr:class I adenylate-forming enzyme family protein [Phenylobacterium sp.]HVI32015.1 class I adenylate-forming enzyme family protein [Phenylobacterium sp.]
MSVEELLAQDFGTIADVIREQAKALKDQPALVDAKRTVSYAELDALMDRIAAALQRDGVGKADVAAICASSSVEYGATFFGILRAAAIVAPLAPSSTPESLIVQLEDSGAKVFFLDKQLADHMAGVIDQVKARRVSLDGSDCGTPFEDWLAPEGAKPVLHEVDPDQGFNIIYSSGTTGAPKGIVQPHRMRWGQIRRGVYPPGAVTMVSTPLYSNTTLVSFLPTISNGGTAVLMPKFDVKQFLELSEKHRATHAMLVPVQYRRLMEYPDFDRYDLSSFQMKFSTSAPFSAALKRQVLDRWPGGLVEYYGMTEGGGSCGLLCHEFPDKLHTVGRPLPGHDIRLIDEEGKEVPQGQIGEVVGRSGAMMVGYHNQPGKTSEAEWWSPEGLRYIRTGDVGRFDEDGFLTLMDRKKDMIISGGFNIYPSDLEAELVKHEAVLEAAVVGVPSDKWGETPVAYVALKPGQTVSADELKAWLNGRVGKTQRLADLQFVDSLPRSHIGKILKRELRDAYQGPATAA